MHLVQDRSKWRAVVNKAMNDRALLHVISLVKRKADTSCAVMFTFNFTNVASHMAQDPHTAVLSRTPLTADARTRSQVSPCNIRSGHSGTVTVFFFFTSSFAVNIIPTILHKHFSATRCSCQKNQQTKPGNLPKAMLLRKSGTTGQKSTFTCAVSLQYFLSADLSV
jgi:hypothetical protein